MKTSKDTVLACGLALGGLASGHMFRRDAGYNTSQTAGQLPLSSDPDFHFELMRPLSVSAYEGADVGEVLVTAAKITPGDYESWYDAWYAMAERTHNKSIAIDPKKFPVSARTTLFREATYYRSADFFLHGNWSDPRIMSLWQQQADAFNKAIALLPVPGKRYTLKSKGPNSFQIPAIWYGSQKKGPQPTIIFGTGYDGSQEEMYHSMVKSCLDRGYNCMTYEGPGQPSPRRYQNLGFIPNWEAVVTPVVDFLLSGDVHKSVDPKSIGLVGSSFGGYLAPRAAAFEHRLAAIFAIDGVMDFGGAILKFDPPGTAQLLKEGNATAINAQCDAMLAMPNIPTSAKWGIQQGMWSFKADSCYDFLKDAMQYNLTDIVPKIKTPVFVGDAQSDGFFPGQAKQLADALGSMATYHAFYNEDGAGAHCQVGAEPFSNQVAFDWFETLISKKK